MFKTMLPLVLLFVSGTSSAIEFPIEIIEYIDNTKVVAFVNEDDIDKSLRWSPFETPPPLSMTDALKLVQKQMAMDPELANAHLTGIELKPIPHHDGQWHYLVKLKNQVGDKPHARYFVLLMNSKVIAGMREPETVK